MVFDNADSERYDVIEKYIPHGSKGNILITSKNFATLARVTSFASQSVEEMEEEEALSLLLRSSNLGSAFYDDQAAKIVTALGCIPLAIDQAGAYIAQQNYDLEGYLKLYKNHHKDLLSDPGFMGASDYGSPIYGTWDISMEAIKHRADSCDKHMAHPAECALALHGVFAFLYNEKIPEDIFENAAANYKHNDIIEWKEPYPQLSAYLKDTKVLDSNGKWNKFVFNKGIQVLKSFALIKYDGKSKTYFVHPLVHMWGRDRLSYDATISNWEKARALLASSVKVNQDADYSFLKMLLPHVEANNKYAVDLGLGIRYDDEVYSRFAYLFDTQGHWDQATQLRKKIVEEREKKLGESHIRTVEGRSHLAMAYYEQGRLSEAENILEQVLSHFVALFGQQHPRSLTVMGNLSLVYGALQRLAEAETLHTYVIKEAIKNNHSHVLENMNNLAIVYAHQKRFNDAENVWVRVLEESSKLGATHPLCLQFMKNLGVLYWKEGKYEKAEKLFLEVVRNREAILGEDHPCTLESAASLALIFNEQGKKNKAEEFQIKVERYIANVGLQHPANFASMSSLSTMYYCQKKWEEAEKLAVQVMEGRKLQLGEDHPHTVMSMHIAAQIYKSQGKKLDNAVKLLEHVVKWNRENLGETDPNTIECINDLVEVYLIQGRRVDEAAQHLTQMIEGWEGEISNSLLDKTKKLLVDILKRGRESKTEIHASLNDLATIYWIQKKYEEAEAVLMQAMEGKKLPVAGNHAETLKTMNNLAHIHKRKGNLEEAKRLLTQVYDGQMATLGEHHKYTLSSMATLAAIYQEQGNLQDAEVLLKQAVNGMECVLKENNALLLHSKRQLVSLQDQLMEGMKLSLLIEIVFDHPAEGEVTQMLLDEVQTSR